jgi:hypothetical protein
MFVGFTFGNLIGRNSRRLRSPIVTTLVAAVSGTMATEAILIGALFSPLNALHLIPGGAGPEHIIAATPLVLILSSVPAALGSALARRRHD